MTSNGVKINSSRKRRYALRRRSAERWDLQTGGLAGRDDESHSFRQIKTIPAEANWLNPTKQVLNFCTTFWPQLHLWRVEVEGDKVGVGGVKDSALAERDVRSEDGTSLGRVGARREH